MNKLRKPQKQKLWPSAIAIVTLARNQDYFPVAWAFTATGEGIPFNQCGTMSEDSLNALIGLLGEASLPGVDCLVVADEAYSTLTAIGFWKACKEGRIVLKGADERVKQAPRCIVEDPPTIIHYGMRGRGGNAVICDVRNWGWAIPQEETERATLRGADAETDKKIILALMGKLASIRWFLKRYDNLLKEARLGDSWRMTAGSQAFYGFRSNYMEAPIEASRCDETESLIERASYGGRCECFQLGEVPGPIYQYDVNQLYSFAASISPVPVECLGDCTAGSASMEIPEMWNCAADVLIKTSLPIYPYRASGENGDRGQPLVIYPVGQFRTFLAGPELQLAFDCGHVVETYYIVKYSTEKALREWALRMWDIRKGSDPEMRKVVKGIALSLYGKFGQRLREWSPDDCELPPPGVDVGDWYTARKGGGVDRHRVLCGQCATEITGGYAQQSSPPIAAWICSAARLHLQRLMNIAGGCYYCDTDSLWVDRAGHLRIQDSEWAGPDLGQLRLVQDWERVDFRGIKHYVAEGNVSRAGVPARAEAVGECRFQWQEDCSFNGHMHSREWPSKRIVTRSYRGQALYRHGIPQADGRVLPHVLS